MPYLLCMAQRQFGMLMLKSLGPVSGKVDLTQYSTAGYENRRYPVEVFDQIPLADRHHPGCLW
jgi:hypothetical protein